MVIYTVIKIEEGWVTLLYKLEDKVAYAEIPRSAFKGNVYYGMQTLLEGREA